MRIRGMGFLVVGLAVAGVARADIQVSAQPLAGAVQEAVAANPTVKRLQPFAITGAADLRDATRSPS
jgi:hypothetical protein